MIKYLLTSGFKWIDPKMFDLNKYRSNSSKECIASVEYPKELPKLQDNYSLDSDKIEIKCVIYQFKIANFYNIPIGKVCALL